MSDIPLSKVQVIWAPDDDSLPQAALVEMGGKDDRRYDKSWGACNQEFNETDDRGRLELLFKQFAHMTAFDKVKPKKLHKLFMNIPEYRRAMADFGSIDPATV